MTHHKKLLSLVVFGSLFSCLSLCDCRKLEGYKFPVYTTQSCPSNETEWEARSSVFNCQGESSYACFPNENITELLEFCYPDEVISSHEGICLFLVKNRSEVDSYDCKHFVQGCPTGFYTGSTVYKYPSCILIGNGCFLAEPTCKSVTEESFPRNSLNYATQRTSINNTGSYSVSIVTVLGMFLLLCVPCVLLGCFLLWRKNKSKGRTSKDQENLNKPLLMYNDQESNIEEKSKRRTYKDQENLNEPLLMYNDQESNIEETEFEKSVFGQWQQDDNFFYSTKATKEVENLIKSSNLVMVTGHSGSGKSAIIQHIALKYRKEGWIVKPVYKFEDIHNACKSMNLKSSKCMFVFNNPIGRESFDEVLYDDWLRHRETLNIFIVDGKLVMSCRKSLILDKRARGFFKDKLKQIDINDSHCKLTTEEKEKMLQKHLSDKKAAKELFAKICDTEIYFPLLCKLYKGKLERNENVSNVLHEPVEVLKDEIESYKNKDKEKYCALVCLILSNNELCINDLKGNNELFSLCLQLCELPTHTSTDSIRNKLDSLEGFFVKTIGKNYSFYNDFVMEVITHVFGSEHPRDTIKFADLSFLRKRIKIENSQSDDFLTIVVNEDNIVHLVDRFFEEMFGSRFIEVVLNPCLRNELVINGIKTKLKCLVDKKKLEMIIKLQKKPVKWDLKSLTDNSSYSRLKFVSSEIEPSTLFALIAFCHDELSMFCLNLLREENINLKKCGLFAAVCSNGNDDLFKMFTKDEISECKEEQWNDLYPIHIVSVFHNYNLLDNVLTPSGSVNMFSTDGRKWTSLHMALVIEMGESSREESTESDRRDKTVEGLIQRGADVNICNSDGLSPLHIACYNGHESTVELLLQNGAKVNLCDDNKSTPILEACRNGHENTVQVLLQNGAEVNKRDKWGTSPITRASENGHTSTVQLLLQNGAMVNILDNNKSTPLLVACRNGHKSTVQLLLQKGAMVNILDNNKSTPLLVACRNGHENTVQLLLQNGAEVNKANMYKATPLLEALKKGHESIVQLLLQSGAKVNLFDRDGYTCLFAACRKEHENVNTVQLLLQNGAEVNQVIRNGSTPLFIASHYGHKSTVQLLLQYGSDVNKAESVAKSAGWVPIMAASKGGHDSIVNLLLQKGAEVNILDINGSTPILGACRNGHEKTVKLLLQNGAKVDIPDKNGVTPILAAIDNKHESIVQLLKQECAK